MAKEYLDKTGLTYFWGKCKEHFQPKYPIGSVYESVNDVNPATYFGGTWKKYGALITDDDTELVTSDGYNIVIGDSSVITTYKWVRTA